MPQTPDSDFASIEKREEVTRTLIALRNDSTARACATGLCAAIAILFGEYLFVRVVFVNLAVVFAYFMGIVSGHGQALDTALKNTIAHENALKEE